MALVDVPPPVYQARAIADLAAERVRNAWRYLDRWAALESAGVPAGDRDAFLAKPLDTEPLAKVRRWWESGERGLLVLVGDVGTGKGYAAARWVLDRRKRGLATHWLAAEVLGAMDFKRRDAALARALDAPALVLDDIGSGATQGEHLQAQLTGVIKTGIDELQSMIVISNGSQDEMRAWLGPRIVDRCQVAGGFVPIASRDSMRTRSTVELDGYGRGPEWYRAHRIVSIVGVREVQRYDEAGDALHLDLDVGEALEAAARRKGFEACKQARELLDLDEAEVVAKARDLAEHEAKQWEHLEGTLGVRLRGRSLSLEGEVAEMAEANKRRSDELREQGREEVQRIVDKAQSRRAANVWDEDETTVLTMAPRWTMGTDGQRRMHEYGVRVKPVGNLFAVYFQDRRMSLDPHDTPGEAWAFARTLFIDVPLPGESTQQSSTLHKD